MEPCQMFDSMERKIAYDNPIRTNCAKEKRSAELSGYLMMPFFPDIVDHLV